MIFAIFQALLLGLNYIWRKEQHMKLIKPLDIASTIMSLIEESEEKVVFVSPYYGFSNWRKLNTVLERAINRDIELEFFVRANQPSDIQQILDLGYEPMIIERLHAKLYFNEKEAVVTSMNLVQGSDEASLDIALITETEKEYQEVIVFFEKHIQSRVRRNTRVDIDSWLFELRNRLKKFFKQPPHVSFTDSIISVNGSNLYKVFIANERTNKLRLNCVLNEKEFSYLAGNIEALKIEHMNIEIQNGGEGYCHLLWGTVDDLKSKSIESLTAFEAKMVHDVVSVFVLEVERLKDKVRTQRNS